MEAPLVTIQFRNFRNRETQEKASQLVHRLWGGEVTKARQEIEDVIAAVRTEKRPGRDMPRYQLPAAFVAAMHCTYLFPHVVHCPPLPRMLFLAGKEWETVQLTVPGSCLDRWERSARFWGESGRHEAPILGPEPSHGHALVAVADGVDADVIRRLTRCTAIKRVTPRELLRPCMERLYR